MNVAFETMAITLFGELSLGNSVFVSQFQSGKRQQWWTVMTFIKKDTKETEVDDNV